MAVQNPRVFVSNTSSGGDHALITLPATSPMIHAYLTRKDLRELDSAEYTAYNGGSTTWKLLKTATGHSHGEAP